MNQIERAVQAFDRFQQRTPVLGLPIGVIRKFADDRASAFGALLTFYGFLAMFPLLVIGLTVLSRWAEDDPELEEALLDSVVNQIPIVGGMIEDDVSTLQAGGVGLAVGIAGLLWGATGLYNSGQLAMSQVWNVEGLERPGLVWRLVRSLVLFVVLGVGALGTGYAIQQGVFAPVGAEVRLATLTGSLLFGFVMFVAIFRILTPLVIETKRLLIGAALAAVGWEGVQILGGFVIAQELDQSDVYGVFAYVIALLMWFWLVARVLLFSAEAAVVIDRGWWPRNLAQPPLNDADKKVLAALARNERRRPEQHIEVWFDDDEDDEEKGRDVGRYEDHPDGADLVDAEERGD
ncbi:MAG: YihY/virulence factor BrkB family protein [Acidimicrobiales bacterium]